MESAGCDRFTHLFALYVTLFLQHLAVSDFSLDEILFRGGKQKTFGIHWSDDVVPHRASLPVVATHATGEMLLQNLPTDSEDKTSLREQTVPAVSIIVLRLNLRQPRCVCVGGGVYTSGGFQSVVIVSAFICLRNSKC